LRAYVLIQTDGGNGLVADELREVPGVVSAEDVTGAYDAIAVARSDSMRYLTEVILPEIRKLPGVTRALPAPLLDGSTRDDETELAGRVAAADRAA
jgi:DNA-binding Lrp family transcriptional regulator